MDQIKQVAFVFVSLICALVSASVSDLTSTHKLPETLQSQKQQISGQVVDETTGEPIAFCNIAQVSSSIGTSTNELGEFVITVDKLPVKLLFSHINYSQQNVEIINANNIKISLSPLTTILEEVIVKASKKNDFAEKLAKKAFKKAEDASQIDHYSHAFYRQKSKNGEEYSEFSEIFYDIKYGTNGIEDWNIIEGRYALQDNSVYNRNYTLFSRILKPTQPNTDELILPSHSNFEIFYDLKVNDIVKSEDSKIAVLFFKPKKSIKTPAFEGEVYIDMDTHDILKINWGLSRDDVDFVTLANKNSSWKDYSISYEIVYKRDSSKTPLLDYIKVDQSFDYYIADSFQSRSTTTSNLTFYEHYTPTSRKKLGGRLRANVSDWRKLDEIGYNEQFWIDNPIIKRTPVDEEVISSFEKVDAFSSIFLNSAENIALMNSNISDDTFVKALSTQMNLYNNNNPTEKVFLHTDKALFSSGENLWYSAFAVIGSDHQYTNASRTIHVDLIDPEGKIIESQTHELINGRGSGNLKLPAELNAGTYQLRAYTQWMQNFEADFFFTKNIEVLNAMDKTTIHEEIVDKIDVQFFPEGGHLVAGIASKVAFKAINSKGLDTPVKGKVVDASGKQVALLSTFNRGSGFFQLLPKAGEQYMAVLEDGTQFTLPQILDTGYTFTIDNLNDKSVRLNVQASEALRNKPFYIIAHTRQRRYYQGRFEFGTKAALRFEIPKTQIPSGVLTLTLFGADKKARCERIVFVNNQEELVISTKISHENFTKRGKINLQINVTDTDGRPIATDLSVAATDVNQVLRNQNSNNILTHLLLQSDLKGHISNPALLFKDKKRATLHSLDLVMLTNGYRKFDWTNIWEKQDVKKEFNFAKGLVVSGKVRRTNNKPMPEAALNVVAKSSDLMGMLSTKTGLDGKFVIPDFNFKGDTQLVFNAFDSSDNPVDAKVTLDKSRIKLPESKFKSRALKIVEKSENYLTYSSARSRMDALYDFDAITELDEVIVTEKKVEQGGAPSTYGQKPDATIYASDNIAFQTVLQLVGLFAGVTVNGNKVSIRNGGSPLWVLNGIPVYNENPSASASAIQAQGLGEALQLSIASSTAVGEVPAFIATMDTFTVERLEILKGPRAAIYGSRGANGVILIYTSKGVGQTRRDFLAPEFTISGHAPEKVFYSPKYDVKIEAHDTPDYRATLYWNPSVATDKEGNATIEFYNSDTAKQFQLSIEGLSNGIPGSYLQTFGRSE